MQIYVFFEIGLIIFLGVLLLALIGGTAYELVCFINNNLGLVILICAIAIILEIILVWWFSKQILPSLSTIVYSTQFCFFVVFGIYQLGKMVGDHPLKCIILFFLYAIYVLLNSSGLLLLPTLISDSAIRPKHSVLINSDGWTICIASIFMGLIGWLLNWWILF